jgi:hypothetical protein
MNSLGVAQALEPPKKKPKPVALTAEQTQLLQVAKILSDQERAQLRIGIAGAVGVVLLCTTGYLIWGRR